jgi:hydroxyacylglutathione hydrolase
MPQSTVGYEKLANWALTTSDEAAFVAEVLAGQPEPPAYFAHMKRINRDGPRILGGLPRPAMLDGDTLQALLAGGSIVVDVRSADTFGAAFIPGTINIPLTSSFSTWAGWLLPYDRAFRLIADDGAVAGHAARELAMIGLDHVAGWFPAGIVGDWSAAGRATGDIPHVHSADIALRLAEVVVVDVRHRSEWELGHLDGAVNIPLGELVDRMHELPRGRPIVVHCEGGTRSAIAASILCRYGVDDVVDLRGGYAEWTRDGFPVTIA